MSTAIQTQKRLTMRPGAWLVWGAVAFFLLVLAGIVGAVVVSSFGTKWFGGWLPSGWTTRWYGATWREFDLGGVLMVTLEVALAVVVISLLVGVPAAYALARRTFPGKRVLMVAVPAADPASRRSRTACRWRPCSTSSTWPAS